MLFTHLYQAFWADETIWWTPAQLRLTVEEAGDRFKGTLLTGALATSFGFGVFLAFLVVGSIQWVREKKG